MKVLIIFGSSRGRTKEIASLIKEELEKNSFISRIDLIDIKEGIPAIEVYDLILLGSSTWDRGDLQRDFYKKEKQLLALNLEGKKGACFGSASILYPYYGEAITILENISKKIRLKIAIDSLLIDDMSKDPSELVRDWCLKLLSSLSLN